LKETPSFALAFLSGPGRVPDYGRRLARLRWQRAFASQAGVEVLAEDLARERFRGPEAWLVVSDETALPLQREKLPEPPRARVLIASGEVVPESVAHTLREFETARLDAAEPARDPERPPVALLFRPEEFPPSGQEKAGAYIERLSAPPTPRAFDPLFGALSFDDPFGHSRPEVTRRLPSTVERLLDVGCGAGEASAALKSRRPRLHVTGIESDSRAAARARGSLDRVLEGDAGEILAALACAGEKYEGFLFADVLEHLQDPIAPLSRARSLAAPGATLLVSVPNVGHLSVVRDLLLGRFDPVAAGLHDAGHLRWFTRGFLEEALDEAGWRVLSIESLPGAPAPDAEEFLSWLSDWPDADRGSLSTYQWLAVARAG